LENCPASPLGLVWSFGPLARHQRIRRNRAVRRRIPPYLSPHCRRTDSRPSPGRAILATARLVASMDNLRQYPILETHFRVLGESACVAAERHPLPHSKGSANPNQSRRARSCGGLLRSVAMALPGAAPGVPATGGLMASPITVRWCRTAAGRTSSRRKDPSDVAAAIPSILLEAARMSLKNETSCRIDDAGLFENVRAYPRLKAALGHQIDLAPDQSCKSSLSDSNLRSPMRAPGSNSTITSISLSGRISPRAADPKKESSETRYRRQRSTAWSHRPVHHRVGACGSWSSPYYARLLGELDANPLTILQFEICSG